jgi:RecA/RadA recombinase
MIAISELLCDNTNSENRIQYQASPDQLESTKHTKRAMIMARKKKQKQEDGGDPFEGLPEMNQGKRKALDAALTDITKRYGDGAIMRLGDSQHLAIETIPTGSLTLDIALGVGGVPRGRITEIYGPESSGKTTLCLSIIAQSQRQGGLCAFVDMEHALDPTYAERIGVSLDTLYISQPDTGEQALEITESLVRSGALDVVVVDSVAALVPRAEIEGEMGDTHVGLQARLMSQALRKLSSAIQQSNTTVIFTNQLREKIGVMFGCFQYSTRVTLADGTTEKIGKIVNQKMDVEVLSYDAKSRMFEPRRIVNWFDNGTTGEFLEFEVQSHGGVHQFTCTPNHLLLTEDGYVPAIEISVGEKLITAVPEHAMAGMTEVSKAPTYQSAPMPVLSIEPVTLSADNNRFDIEVEGNHCYVVDGVVVHNSPETTSGGRALKFYASVRLDIRRIQAIKQGGSNIGNRTRVRVTKNKVSAPFREAEFDIMFYQNGISKFGEIIDLGVDLGTIEKRGAFFRYQEGLLGQGRENAKIFLTENPAIANEIENAIRTQFELPTMPIVADDGSDAE